MTDTDIFIDNRQALAGLIPRIAQETTVSLDTEFVRERTYYPRLCLIQIATPKLTACIDCLADLELGPLFESLLDARSTWVLHSARQDLEVIHQHIGRLPARLIDTQIAAGLLGHSPQISLQDLLQFGHRRGVTGLAFGAARGGRFAAHWFRSSLGFFRA